MTTPASSSPPAPRKPLYTHLYVQVIIGVVLGIVVGGIWPEAGKELKPLGDGFIKLIKMMIAPIIFCTVVHGIASMGELKKLGRLFQGAGLFRSRFHARALHRFNRGQRRSAGCRL